jgi:hypothetical protein
MHADGRIDHATLKQLLKVYQREKENQHYSATGGGAAIDDD